MSRQTTEWEGFDPAFDDTTWTNGWLRVPIALVPPGLHASGYRIERRILRHFDVFGQSMELSVPLECRLLFDPENRLWMSDTPQERIMMYNNGGQSRGRVLVGGLGLGLYPQYAVSGGVGAATSFHVIERSSVVRDIVEPTLSVVLSVPLHVQIGDAAAYLSGPPRKKYDTIFLDTWETLDATHLPVVNGLRDRALRHLAPGGRVLLWGYRWMVRLFEDACRRLLAVPPERRRLWLGRQQAVSPQAVALLSPVMERFDGQVVGEVEQALAWCRQYITSYVAGA